MDKGMTATEAQTILETNFAPWVRALDMSFRSFDADGAVLTIPVSDQVARVGGIVSGQALATLADTAMVFACLARLGRLELVSTVTLDTQFLRAAAGERIRAEAEVTRLGRSLIFTRASLWSEPSEKQVAFATGTFARPPEQAVT